MPNVFKNHDINTSANCLHVLSLILIVLLSSKYFFFSLNLIYSQRDKVLKWDVKENTLVLNSGFEYFFFKREKVRISTLGDSIKRYRRGNRLHDGDKSGCPK